MTSDFNPLLEDVLGSFPKKTALADGLPVLARPLQAEDQEAFHLFFQDVSETERLFLKHRVQDRNVIDGWCRDLNYEVNFPLLAFHEDGRVLASATLHQNPMGWRRHIGRVSVFVHRDFRKRGLAQTLLREVVEVARRLGLEKLEAEFVKEQERALHVFAHMGFSELARLPRYVMDMEGKRHDYVLLGLHLPTDIEYAGVG